MDYDLVKSSNNYMEKLIEYKKNSIFEYVFDLSAEEIKKISDYAYDNVLNNIDNYKNIVIDGSIVGCLLLTDKDYGVFLDEIYLEKGYRNKEIGTDIIKKVILENDVIYLWVYKLNNKEISLYMKLGFKIIEDMGNRYYMKYGD